MPNQPDGDEPSGFFGNVLTRRPRGRQNASLPRPSMPARPLSSAADTWRKSRGMTTMWCQRTGPWSNTSAGIGARPGPGTSGYWGIRPSRNGDPKGLCRAGRASSSATENEADRGNGHDRGRDVGGRLRREATSITQRRGHPSTTYRWDGAPSALARGLTKGKQAVLLYFITLDM